MKKFVSFLLAICLVMTFGFFAIASGEETTEDQGTASVDSTKAEENNTNLGDYKVEILSCRLTKDYEDKSVVIIKYSFTNNAEESTSFMAAFDAQVYQNGVGLNESIFVDEADEYSADNQTKEIKKGASLDVEVAYELNDTETDVEVEVSELFSFDESKVTKTFSITE